MQTQGWDTDHSSWFDSFFTHCQEKRPNRKKTDESQTSEVNKNMIVRNTKSYTSNIASNNRPGILIRLRYLEAAAA